MTNETQESKYETMEDWEVEMSRVRVFPEPGDNKRRVRDECLYKTNKYMLNGREFKYVPDACMRYSDIQRYEGEIPYTFEPGTEGLAAVIYDTVVDTVESINSREGRRLITAFKLKEDLDFFGGGGVDRRNGRTTLCKQVFEGLPDAGKRELLQDFLHHEAGHRKFEYEQDKEEFQRIWSDSVKQKITSWFEDGNFWERLNGSNSFTEETRGHPQDSPTELYASAYLIAQRHRPKFNQRFYSSATQDQKLLVDEIFEYAAQGKEKRK